jgi:hypothetical protein
VDLFGNSPPSNPSSYPMHSILWGVVGGQRPRANRASSQSITNFSQPPKYHKANFAARSPGHPTGKAESTKNADIRLKETARRQVFVRSLRSNNLRRAGRPSLSISPP